MLHVYIIISLWLLTNRCSGVVLPHHPLPSYCGHQEFRDHHYCHLRSGVHLHRCTNSSP